MKAKALNRTREWLLASESQAEPRSILGIEYR